MKVGRGIVASGLLATSLLLSASGTALANGVGDLYVASSAGVLEVHVDTQRVVNTVPIVPAPTTLAFSPDGAWLFVGSDASHVTPIEIETLDTGDPIATPGDVTALAFPNGQLLVGAMPARHTLAIIDPSTGKVTESERLPGAGNLLAGDRHDARVAVAEAGASWLEILDPATKTYLDVTVKGEIRALAIDRDRGDVLVATHAPDAVLSIDLASQAVRWTAPLTAVPASVVPLATDAAVACGSAIYRVSSAGATALATATAPVLALAASDEGKALHAAEKDAVEVFDTAGKQVRTIKLSGDRASRTLAPVPAGSSLFTGKQNHAAAQSAKPGGTGASAGTGKAPTTSVVSDEVGRLVKAPQVQGGLAVALAILGICWLAIRWHDRRARAR